MPGTVVASCHATRYHAPEDGIIETNSMELNSCKTISFSLSEEISHIMVYRRLITGFTVFTGAWHLFLLWAWQIQSMYCHCISLRSILSVCECAYSCRKHLLAYSCLSVCLCERGSHWMDVCERGSHWMDVCELGSHWMGVCELGSHWMDVCGIWYLRVVLKSVRKIKIWLKSNKSIR